MSWSVAPEPELAAGVQSNKDKLAGCHTAVAHGIGILLKWESSPPDVDARQLGSF